MSFWFHRSAAATLLSRRKGAVARMVLTSTAASLWCIVGGIWALAMWRETTQMAGRTQLELFLHADADASAVSNVRNTLERMPAIDRVEVVDGDRLWRELQRDLRLEDTGLTDIVRPPTLIRCTPRVDEVRSDRMTLLASTIRDAHPVVDRAIWPYDYVRVIERRRTDIMVLGSVAGGLSVLLFILAMLYAFRAELHLAGNDLRIGAVLGATPTFIAMPHILVSMTAGLVGLGLACGAIAGAWPWLSGAAPWLALVQPWEIASMAGALGVIGSVISWWQSVATAARASRG